MKVQVQKLPGSKVELRIEVPVNQFENSVKKAVFDLGNSLKIKGFRKGHIPKEIIEKEISSKEILNTAAEIAVKENYIKAIRQLAEEQKIEVISQPRVEILKLAQGNPFEFKVQVQVLPQILLPDYKNLASKVKRQNVQVAKKEIDEALLWLQRSRAKLSAVLRPAKKGDFVSIEFSSPHIENGKRKKDGFVLGKGYLVPGFEGNLEGMETGQEKEFALTFPKNHFQKELSGREIGFKVKMISVQKMELPEIDDQFAKNLGQFDDLIKLKEGIKQGVLREKEKEELLRTRQEILKNIAGKTDCEIPEVLIAREKEIMMNELKQRVSQNLKIKIEEYFSSIKKTEKEVSQSFSPGAEKRVKEFLVLREISKKENVKVSEEEVKEEINKMLKQYPEAETAKNKFDLEKLRNYTEEILRNEKVFQLLEDAATNH